MREFILRINSKVKKLVYKVKTKMAFLHSLRLRLRQAYPWSSTTMKSQIENEENGREKILEMEENKPPTIDFRITRGRRVHGTVNLPEYRAA
jgi:hypothetical protein